jgi:hypothetical protein
MMCKRLSRLWSVLALALAATCGPGPDSLLNQMPLQPGSGAPSSLAPAIESVTPAQGPNSGGLTLRIAGQNFQVGAELLIGGAPASEVTVLSGTRITARLPPTPGVFGPADVVIRNPDGGEVLRRDGFLYYASPLPFANPLFDDGTHSLLVSGDFDGDQKMDLVTDTTGGVHMLRNDGSGGFVTLPAVAVGTKPVAAATADFNQDQKLDLVVANSTSNDVSVLLGDGAGGFAAAVNLAVGSAPSAVVVGDWNGDRQLDLAVTNANSNSVSVLLGDGAGAFAAAASFLVGGSPRSLAAGDLNGDGHADLAVANGTSNTLSVLLGDGRGGFLTPTSLALSSSPSQVLIADLNGDRSADLLAASQTGKTASAFLGDGRGAFTAGPAAAIVAIGPMTLRDLNGDQREDLIVAGSSMVSVLAGDGSGGFLPAVSSYSLNLSSNGSVLTADLNGDTLLDVVVANGRGVTLLLGAGQGRFSGASPMLSLGNNRPIVGDWNGDHKLDVFTNAVNFGDGSGGIFAIARSVILGGYGGVAADVNVDGRQDVIVVVSDANGRSSLNVLLGDGQGGLASGKGVNAGPPGSVADFPVAAVDLNGDAWPDLITKSSSPAAVRLNLGDGQGGFPNSTVLYPPLTTTDVAAADFNQDGKVDLVISGTGGSSAAVVLLGTGTAGFGAPQPLFTGALAHFVAAGDFDGDRRLDVAAINRTTGQILLALGDGQGGFPRNPALSARSAGSPYCVSTGDFNADGRTDLAISRTGAVSLLLGSENEGLRPAGTFSANASTPFCALAADFDGDRRDDLIVPTQALFFLKSQL